MPQGRVIVTTFPGGGVTIRLIGVFRYFFSLYSGIVSLRTMLCEIKDDDYDGNFIILFIIVQLEKKKKYTTNSFHPSQ